MNNPSINSLTFFVASMGECNDRASLHDSYESAAKTGMCYIDNFENGKFICSWEYYGDVDAVDEYGYSIFE